MAGRGTQLKKQETLTIDWPTQADELIFWIQEGIECSGSFREIHTRVIHEFPQHVVFTPLGGWLRSHLMIVRGDNDTARVFIKNRIRGRPTTQDADRWNRIISEAFEHLHSPQTVEWNALIGAVSA